MPTLANFTWNFGLPLLPDTKSAETTPVDISRPLVDPIVEQNKKADENKTVQVPASPWGNAMPVSIGARALTGKIIWSSDLREVAQPEPVDDTTQVEPHYEADIAISFGKAIIDPAVRINTTLSRLWAQQVLCYNVAAEDETAQFARMSVTFHPGLIDAQPDATVQADKGDLTPAWRNQIYVVIKNFPLWLVGLSDGLPDFVAEIFDQADNGPTITNYTMKSPPLNSGLHLWAEAPLLFDSKRNVYYAWDTQNMLSTLDAETHTEISRVEVASTSLLQLQAENLCVHDSINQYAIISDTIGNTTPLHLVNLTNGRVLRSLGKSSIHLGLDLLNADPTQVEVTYKDTGAPIQCSVQGVIIYGAVLGGAFDSVGVVYYAYDGSTFQLSDSRLVSGSGIGLGGWGNISCVAAYPIIGRKDLFPNGGSIAFDDIGFKLGKNPNLKQDAYAFVGHGDIVTMYRIGPDLVPGSPIVNNAVLHIKEAIDVATFPGGQVNGIIIDPIDHSLIVFWHPLDKLSLDVTYMAKIKVLLSSYSQNADGTMSGFRPIIGSMQYNVALPQAFRAGLNTTNHREFPAWPLFGYVSGGSGDFVEVDTATGNTAYITPIARGDLLGYVYDGKHGTVEFINRGSGFVEHIRLRGATGEPMPLATILAALMQSAGYSPSQFDIDVNIDDMALGAMLDRSADLWATMQNIGMAYDFMYYASGTVIKFKKPDLSATAPAFAVDIDALYPNTEQPYDSITTTFASPDELPGNTGITYIDKDQLYVSNTQTFRRTNFPVPVVDNANDTTVPVPIVMTAAEALRRSGMATFNQLVKGEVVSFKLPVGYLASEPVDIIQVTDGGFTRTVLVGEVVVSPEWCISITGTNRNVRINNRFRVGPDGNWITVGAPPFVTDPPKPPTRPASTSPTDPVLLDIPLLTSLDDVTDAYITLLGGAASKVKTGWVGATVSTEFNDEPWSTLMQTTTSMPLGRFVSPTLPPTIHPFQTDSDTVLTIAASNFDPALLTSISDDDFRAGKNAVLIGAAGRWELVYFRDAAVVDNTVQLSNITRGCRGTEVFCGTHDGADLALFVVLNGVRQLGIASVVNSYTRVGDTFRVRARGTNFSGAVDTASVAIEGQSLKPWAPAQPQALLGSLVNAVGSPSYTNTCGGGPFGGPNFSRTSAVKVTSSTGGVGGVPENLVDGDFTSGTDHSFHIPAGLTSLTWTFDFRPSGCKQIITALVYDTQGGASVGGTYTVEASNDQITWVPLTTGIALAAGVEYAWSNATGYSFYRVRLSSGTTLDHVGHEFLFKTMADVAANDVLLTWKRRDRLGNEQFTFNQPLSEQTESYDLDIFSTGVKVRTVAALAGSGYLYTVANQTTDGFSQPMAILDVAIYQNGAHIGRGLATEVTLDVKDHL